MAMVCNRRPRDSDRRRPPGASDAGTPRRRIAPGASGPRAGRALHAVLTGGWRSRRRDGV